MSRNTLGQLVRTCVDTALTRRAEWDRLDAAVGDGDFGSSVARGAQALAAHWDALERGTAETFLGAVGALLRREMGGSSGPLLAVACERAGAAAGDVETIDIALAGAMLQAAAAGVAEYGQSAVGDKTLLDARATRDFVARRGRAVYSAERNVGAPDPGAVAVAEIAAAAAAAAGVEVPDLSELQPQPAEPVGRADAVSSTKKFLNDPVHAALDSLAGLARSAPELVRWDDAAQIIVRATPLPAGQVGLVSGGGSGHEPLHAGFVGPGMLTAAAPGAVFASPSVDQILAATRAAAAGGGVLHIVKNYTGDVLNFRLAAEAAQAEGIDVASVLVDDDVAVNDSAHTVGKRGTGATLFVHKIAGAVAEAGGTLEQVRSAAADVVRRSASFGFALTSCSPPGAGPILTLGADEIEVGVGIHGEQGRRSDVVRPAADLVAEAADILVASLELGAGSRVAALVNGMGGTPLMELYILFNDLADELARRHISIARNLVGNYVTSLDMAGASFTLMAFDDQLAKLWDAPAHTAALRWGC